MVSRRWPSWVVPYQISNSDRHRNCISCNSCSICRKLLQIHEYRYRHQFHLLSNARRRRSPHLGSHVLSGRRSQGAASMSHPTATNFLSSPELLQEPDSTTASSSDSGGEDVMPSVTTPQRYGHGPLRADHSIFNSNSNSCSRFAVSPRVHFAFLDCPPAVTVDTVSASSDSVRKRPFSALGSPVPATCPSSLSSVPCQLSKAACLEGSRSQRPASCTPCIVTNPRYRRRSVEPPPPATVEQPQQLSPPRASRLPPPPPSGAVCLPITTQSTSSVSTVCAQTPATQLQQTEKRRRSGGRILLDSLRRSAKKTAASLRRAVSTERLVSDVSDLVPGELPPPPPPQMSAAVVPPVGNVEGIKKTTKKGSGLKRLVRRFSVGGKENNPGSPVSGSSSDSGNKPLSSRVLEWHPDGSKTIRLCRIGPRRVFGFYVSKGNRNFANGIFVSRVSADMMGALAGLISVGDEILKVENLICRQLSLEEVYEAIGKLDYLTLRVMPYLGRRDAV